MVLKDSTLYYTIVHKPVEQSIGVCSAAAAKAGDYKDIVQRGSTMPHRLEKRYLVHTRVCVSYALFIRSADLKKN